MLHLYCPICERYCDETELVCGGEAHIIRKDETSNDEEFYNYLYARKNILNCWKLGLDLLNVIKFEYSEAETNNINKMNSEYIGI